MSNPIKKPETEAFCQEVAELYLEDSEAASKKFNDFAEQKKLVYWVSLALRERISDIVRQKRAGT